MLRFRCVGPHDVELNGGAKDVIVDDVDIAAHGNFRASFGTRPSWQLVVDA